VPHAFINQPELVELTTRVNDSFLDRTVLNPKTYPPSVPAVAAVAPSNTGRGSKLR
jgi:hypothetical protein